MHQIQMGLQAYKMHSRHGNGSTNGKCLSKVSEVDICGQNGRRAYVRLTTLKITHGEGL